MVYEAHSSDYHTPQALQGLVRDHFAIPKVGPLLAFGYREAVFALAQIEDELIQPEQRSHMLKVLKDTMLQDPVYWKGYYHGDTEALYQARKYSLSDRMRYYWQYPQVQAALVILMNNPKQAWGGGCLESQFANWQRPETSVLAKAFHPENVISATFSQYCKNTIGLAAVLKIQGSVFRIWDYANQVRSFRRQPSGHSVMINAINPGKGALHKCQLHLGVGTIDTVGLVVTGPPVAAAEEDLKQLIH